MSVEKTTGITNQQIDLIKENHSLKKSEGIKAVSNIAKDKESNKLGGVDKVEISSEVKELQKTLSNLKSEIKKVPDIRKEKVEDAKARIESGFYDKDDTIKKVASSISKLARFNLPD